MNNILGVGKEPLGAWLVWELMLGFRSGGNYLIRQDRLYSNVYTELFFCRLGIFHESLAA